MQRWKGIGLAVLALVMVTVSFWQVAVADGAGTGTLSVYNPDNDTSDEEFFTFTNGQDLSTQINVVYANLTVWDAANGELVFLAGGGFSRCGYFEALLFGDTTWHLYF